MTRCMYLSDNEVSGTGNPRKYPLEVSINELRALFSNGQTTVSNVKIRTPENSKDLESIKETYTQAEKEFIGTPRLLKAKDTNLLVAQKVIQQKPDGTIIHGLRNFEDRQNYDRMIKKDGSLLKALNNRSLTGK